jgi:hypothetical protein
MMDNNTTLSSNDCNMQYGCLLPASAVFISYIIKFIEQLFD